MRVDVTPIHADVVGGQPIVLTVMITNTTTVISGFTVRVLGADPSWVTLDQAQISLFPDEVRVVPVTVVLPAGLPAGHRRIAVQVRELTPPERTSITDIDLTVPPVRGLRVRTDPVVVTAGKRAGFSILAENVGNTTILGRLAGDDPEGRVTFVFEPPVVRLAPGEHVVVDMQAQARRPLAGSPVIRPLGVFVDDVGEGFFAGPETDADVVAVRVADTADTNATFVQKSALSRGAFSLVGLLVAVTVFALVITLALSKLVGQSTADRDLALQVAAARNGDGAAAGTSTLMGTVKQLTTGTPLSAVSVAVFDPADTSRPLATTATAADGSWTLSQLAAGKYKLSFQRAGFSQTWYPLASNANDATTVEVKAGQRVQSLDVGLGGLPATISGTVNGDDVSAALLYLETVPGQTNAVRPNVAAASPVAPAPAPPAPSAVPTDPLVGGGAIVQKEPIGSDGTFTLSNVPSPNVYQLVVVKAGYATTSQRLDVGGGEARTGVQLTLRKGDGSISGIVTDTSKPLPEVTITATSGSNSVTTVSLTGAGKAGTFSLSGLPTPGSFTVTATLDGYAPQTLTLTLASGQALKGVQISLGSSAGTLAGVVTEVVHSSPSDPGHTVLSAGVTVTASDGLLSVQSQTESDSATRGNWSISGLPLPGTYTLTFSRPDLAPQTVSATLDAAGVLTNGPLRVVMQSATTSISGLVTQKCPTTSCAPVTEAAVTLTSSSNTYAVTTASGPDPQDAGMYEIDGVVPGTYTLSVSAGSGVSTSSQVVTLTAGTPRVVPVSIELPAGVIGLVHHKDGTPATGWTVFLYRADQYPTTYLATRTTADGQTAGQAAGSFSFDDIDAGDYLIAVGPTSDPTTAVKTVPFTVQPSKVYDLHTITVTP